MSGINYHKKLNCIHIQEDSIRINHFFYTCFSDESQASTWIIVIFLYLALLQVIGIVLAVQTRKVKVKVLNDSKHIAALIYISSIVLVTRAVAVFAVSHLLNVAEVIFSGGIIVLGFAFLSIVFIPKVSSYALYHDPCSIQYSKYTHSTSNCLEKQLCFYAHNYFLCL